MNAPIERAAVSAWFKPWLALASGLALPVLAQVPMVNPLLRPPAPAVATAPASRSDAAPSLPQAQGRSAAERSPVLPAPPVTSPAPRAEGDDIPSAVMERVASLYVAAIVDGSAVLRSQVAVAQPGVGGGGTGAPAPTAAATPGAGAAIASPPAAAGAYRAVSMVVHDSQPIRLFDNYRLLPRVNDEGVVLYLLPPRQRRGEAPRVVFRGLLTSVIAAPFVPARSALESPDGGLDGKARRELSNVDRRIGSGAGVAGNSSGGDGRAGTGGLGTGAGSSANNR